MNDTAIQVQDLGKLYHIGKEHARYETIREHIARIIKSPFQRAAGLFRHSEEDNSTVWALKDVSLEIKQGEAVGIIGRNGAGKTTLLKILSRVTEPTQGWAKVRGRVGSLLEVGTGFHPELTGRENIFLNGAILGMKKEKIKSGFDEIVAFSEIEKFIDTPVKHYSSGMYLRLAFAVAAHLEPEVLLVDEVLAVGDAAFREKCLSKMESVSKAKRTVLFVSHNMAAIEALCQRVIIIDKGQVAFSGEPAEAIKRYLKLNVTSKKASKDLSENNRGEMIIRKIRILDDSGKENSMFRIGDNINLELSLDSGDREINTPVIRFGIENAYGIRVCNLFSDITLPRSFLLKGKSTVTCHWSECRLVPGIYHVKLAVGHKGIGIDVVEQAIDFEIIQSDIYGTGKTDISGTFAPKVSWIIDNS
jgi:lipopolysaccharide transport system ATP-binding protein